MIRMKKYAVIAIPLMVTLVIGYVSIATLVDYLSLPLVGTDYDNNCIWIEVAGENGLERRKCSE